MKIFKVLFLAIVMTLFVASLAMAAADGVACATIQSGTLLTSDGRVITPGFDEWGYNYEAHIFNGGYCDAYRNAAWCQAYADVNLVMKWNDAWLSNKDCDFDGKLDRHFGYTVYKGSGAWLTNHQSGKVAVNGKMRQWTYFSKIVAAEEGDVLQTSPPGPTGEGFYWRGGTILGQAIWGEFVVVEEVYNDPSAGAHGILYKSPVNPGLGNLN